MTRARRAGYPWFRVYSEIKDDPKMLVLTDHQFRIWVSIMAMASESSERGTILPCPVVGLAAALRTTPERLSESLDLFEQLDMVAREQDGALVIVHFLPRQYDNPSDYPTATRERQRRRREARSVAAPDLNGDPETHGAAFGMVAAPGLSGESETPDEVPTGTPMGSTAADGECHEHVTRRHDTEEMRGDERRIEEGRVDAAASTPPKRKRTVPTFGPETVPYQQACHLREHRLRNQPDAKLPAETPAALARWALDVDYLIRLDGRAPASIEAVIDFALHHKRFWQRVIDSPASLRRHWDKIWIEMHPPVDGPDTSTRSNGRASSVPPEATSGPEKRPRKYDFLTARYELDPTQPGAT